MSCVLVVQLHECLPGVGCSGDAGETAGWNFNTMCHWGYLQWSDGQSRVSLHCMFLSHAHNTPVRRYLLLSYSYYCKGKGVFQLSWCLCYRDMYVFIIRNVGGIVGGVLAALIFVGIIIVVVVFFRRQWARSEENKARINARLAGEDEILVSSHLNHL